MGKIKFYNTFFKLIIFTEVLFSDAETLMTYILTPWSRFLLEKPTDSHLVKKYPAFYVTRRSITAYRSARHVSLSSL